MMNAIDKRSSKCPFFQIKTNKQKLMKVSLSHELRKLQRFLLDQRTTPLDTAIYWTEYVLRHNGAYHLQAPSRNYKYTKKLLFHISLLLIFIHFIFSCFLTKKSTALFSIIYSTLLQCLLQLLLSQHILCDEYYGLKATAK